MAGLIVRDTSPEDPIEARPLVLEKGPTGMKREEKSKKAELAEHVNRRYEVVDALRKRVREINASLDNKHHSMKEISQQLTSACNRQYKLNDPFTGLQNDKRALRKELHLADQLRDQRKVATRALKEKLPFVSVQQLDEEVKSLEYKMHHTSLTLREEKRILEQIKDLKKSRVFVHDYNEQLIHIREDESSQKDLLQHIKEIDKMLAELNKQWEDESNVIAEVRAMKAAAAAEITALYMEKNAARDEIWANREEVKLVRRQFKVQGGELYQRQRESRRQQDLTQKNAFDKREAKRKEMKNQKAFEEFVEPFTNEILTCTRLCAYLQKYITNARKEASVLSVIRKEDFNAPLGVGDVLISKKKKSDNELIGWFAGTQLKASTKKDKNNQKPIMRHSFDIVKAFCIVKLSTPSCIQDVPKSLEEVKLASEKFQRLQKEARDEM